MKILLSPRTPRPVRLPDAIVAAIPFFLAAGCVPQPQRPATSLQHLDLAWDLGPRAASDSRFAGNPKKFRRVMIVPPSGNQRGTFERELTVFEKKFLEVGVTLISPAITGRVVGATEGSTGQELSDVERALILARKTGVDVILQVGVMEDGPEVERLLCGDRSEALQDCDSSGYRAAPWKVRLRGPTVRFQGRLIDVENGEVLASIDISQATMNNAAYKVPQDVAPLGNDLLKFGARVEVLGADDVAEHWRDQWFPATVCVSNAEEAFIGWIPTGACYLWVPIARIRRAGDIHPSPGADTPRLDISCPAGGERYRCKETDARTRDEVITAVVQLVSGAQTQSPAAGVPVAPTPLLPPPPPPPEMVGVGAVVELDAYARLVVKKLTPRSAADRAGLKAADGVIAIDGTPTAGMTVEVAVAKLRGAPGTKVLVAVQRQGSPPITVEITREKISVP